MVDLLPVELAALPISFVDLRDGNRVPVRVFATDFGGISYTVRSGEILTQEVKHCD